MTHPDEGTLVALRDGESITETDRAHITACDACLEQLDEVRARAEMVADLLAIPGAPIDVERAKIVVRARLDGQTSSRVVAGSLRRAAIILLVAAGAVSALQSPPVRVWIAERFAEPAENPVRPDAPSEARSDVRSIGVPPVSGLVIALFSAEAGTRLAVTFESRSDVEVSAAEGTRFAIAEGRVEVSDVVGPVVVRVPIGAPALTVTSDGRMMFRGTEATNERDTSGVQADGGWVFRTPAL